MLKWLFIQRLMRSQKRGFPQKGCKASARVGKSLPGSAPQFPLCTMAVTPPALRVTVQPTRSRSRPTASWSGGLVSARGRKAVGAGGRQTSLGSRVLPTGLTGLTGESLPLRSVQTPRITRKASRLPEDRGNLGAGESERHGTSWMQLKTPWD